MGRVEQARARATGQLADEPRAAFTSAWGAEGESVAPPRPVEAPVVRALPIPRAAGRAVEKLVGHADTPAAAADEYAALAAALHRARETRPCRTILVASATTGEGKSLTAANLALTFSRSYRQSVVLVDGDLRQ